MVIACAGRVQADIIVPINRYLLIGCDSEYIHEYPDRDILNPNLPIKPSPCQAFVTHGTIE